jgi:hypothetical protein
VGRLRTWWLRLTGVPTERQDPRPRKTLRDGPHAAEGGLELVDEPPKRKPPRTGAGGFDPYSSDAGYAKPHSWERVDHD